MGLFKSKEEKQAEKIKKTIEEKKLADARQEYLASEKLNNAYINHIETLYGLGEYSLNEVSKLRDKYNDASQELKDQMNNEATQGSKIYEEVKQKQIKIAKKGISSLISAEDYSKVIIEQNQAIIDILAVIAISGGSIASGAALMHQQDYNKRIKQYL